jgi:hypothetical protein
MIDEDELKKQQGIIARQDIGNIPTGTVEAKRRAWQEEISRYPYRSPVEARVFTKTQEMLPATIQNKVSESAKQTAGMIRDNWNRGPTTIEPTATKQPEAQPAKTGGEGVVSAGLNDFITNVTYDERGNPIRFEGPEGVATVEKLWPGSTEQRISEERARQGVYRSADLTRQGVITEATTRFENERKLAEEQRQREESGAAASELEAQRAAGIVPLTGMAEYEANVARSREEWAASKLPPKERAIVQSALAEKRYGAKEEGVKQYLAGKSSVEAAQVRSDWERANAAEKNAIEAQKIGIAYGNAKSLAEYRNAQIQDMMVKTGYLEPMKLALQQAKNATDKAKIQRDFKSRALQDIYKPPIDALSQQLAVMPNDEGIKSQLKSLQDEYASHMDVLIDQYPMDGEVKIMPSGKKRVFNGESGKWEVLEEGVVPTKKQNKRS